MEIEAIVLKEPVIDFVARAIKGGRLKRFHRARDQMREAAVAMSKKRV
jgi:hypothetical protein